MVFAALFILLTAADRITKNLASAHLMQGDKVLIPGVLSLHYLENRGAAFGKMQNKQCVFWLLTAAFLVIALIFFLKAPKTKRYLPLIASVVVLVAGAIGNFIDRIAHQYVVDFIYV